MKLTQSDFLPEREAHSVIDMGYLVYNFVNSQKYWRDIQYLYSASQGYILASEGTKEFNIRKNIFPEYKGNRKENRNQDLHRRAKIFWQEITSNDIFDIRTIDGLEGDDICAMLALKYGYTIVSQDKDFLQIPNVIVEKLDGSQVVIKQSKFPKALQHINFTYRDYLLYLAIDGDKADNVPQLRAKGRAGLEELVKVLEADDSWNLAHAMYGDDLLRNLMLVVLPNPAIFSWLNLKKEELFDLVREDEYIKFVKEHI